MENKWVLRFDLKASREGAWRISSGMALYSNGAAHEKARAAVFFSHVLGTHSRP